MLLIFCNLSTELLTNNITIWYVGFDAINRYTVKSVKTK